MLIKNCFIQLRKISSIRNTSSLAQQLIRGNFSTVNEKQMAQFNNIKNWWSPQSEMNVLFQYNYQRVDFLLKTLAKLTALTPIDQSTQLDSNKLKPLSGKKIIDVGCGAGFLTESLTRLGSQVIGLDPNQTSFQEASSHKGNKTSLSNLKYANLSIQEYLQQNASQKESYDIVTSMDVIQHVDNPEIFLESLVSALKPGGLLMVSTIAKNIKSFFSHIVFAQYISRIVPKGTHNYNKFISPSSLRVMFEKLDLEILDIRQLDYTLKGQFKTTKGGDNYILIARKSSSSSNKEKNKESHK